MTETLTATTARDFKMGHYNRLMPAGTLVEVYAETIEDASPCAYVWVAGRRRLSAVLPKSALIPA